jgi:hypothetical protein
MTFQSVTFGTDNRTVVSNDHDHLNRGVMNPNALSDAQKANVNIATRNGNLTSWNSHGGGEQTTPKVTSVQMQERTGRIAIAGTTVAPDVYENLKETAPQLFEDPAIKAAADAAAEADAAAAAEADAAMNTHPDTFLEESHTQFTNVVPAQLQTELLVQMHRDGAPSNDTLNRVASSLALQLHISFDVRFPSDGLMRTSPD